MERTVINVGACLVLIIILCLAGCASPRTTTTSGNDSVDVDRYGVAPDQFVALAEKGDVAKMMELGRMYAAGKIGYRRDYDKAVYWYEKAAETGQLQAMYELGIIYEYGAGDVAADRARAAYWYRLAGERGDAYCRYRLARVLSKDQAADPVDAEKWFLLAEAAAANCRDNVKCQIILSDKFNYKWELEKQLSEKQKNLARDRAREWRPETASTPASDNRPVQQ